MLAASQKVDGNQRIVLEAISKLTLEDNNCHVHLVAKIRNITKLDRSEVCKALKSFEENKEVKDIIDINIISENLNDK